MEPLGPCRLWKAPVLSTGWLSTCTCSGVKRTSVLTAVVKESEDETLEARINFKYGIMFWFHFIVLKEKFPDMYVKHKCNILCGHYTGWGFSPNKDVDITSREAWGHSRRRTGENVRIKRWREGWANTHLIGMLQTLQAGTVMICPRPTQGQTSQQLIMHFGGGAHWGWRQWAVGYWWNLEDEGVTFFSCGPIGGWAQQAPIASSKPVLTHMAPAAFIGS